MVYKTLAYVVLVSVLLASEPVSAAAACQKTVAKVVSAQGQVQVQHHGTRTWQSIYKDDPLCPGDMLHSARRSRATIVLSTGAVLTIDQNTTMTFSAPVVQESVTAWFIQLIDGTLFSRSRQPQRLDIHTPFINAVHKGTEFMVTVADQKAEIAVFDGQVAGENKSGKVTANKGQKVIAEAGRPPRVQALKVTPEDAVQWMLYYPPIIDDAASTKSATGDSPLSPALSAYRQGDSNQALAKLEPIPLSQQDARYLTLKAALLLTLGRVDEAQPLIRQLPPDNSDALALQAIIAVAKNQPAALDFASQAVAANPNSSTALIAQSYAYQSRFDLDAALKATQQATKLSPDNALAWARLSELQLSQGDHDAALKSAQKAQALNPKLSRTQTILGFANLAETDIGQAKRSFQEALTLDSSDPLARLGLGLSKIRQGDVEEGKNELETAVNLDPNNAITRSYLGKAYYELRNKDYASKEYDIAKEMDPKDPTPYFYDAILKQTTNRPVEALHDMQKAIELNDNRGVYRSKLLLDEDLAARSAAQGRIYDDLGFNQRALLEGWRSTNTDPTDYSGHRLLADNYSALPRHELARTSELLQSQLLQPINSTPIQPHLGERNLAIVPGSGPAGFGFNEFNPLFSKNGFSLQASGVVGSLDTYGEEVVHSGLWDKFSYSLGQFHHQSRGFRDNNGIDQNIYNAFVQGSPTEGVNLQAEYRHRDMNHGDLFYYGDLNFNISEVNRQLRIPDFKRKVNTDSFRFGAKINLSQKSNLLGSLYLIDHLDDFENYAIINSSHKSQRGFMGEVQYQYRSDPYRLAFGAGGYGLTNNISQTSPGPNGTITSKRMFDTYYANIYAYNYLRFPKEITWTFGLSFDSLQNILNGSQDYKQFNPKLGAQWELTKDTIIRAAAFRTLSRGVWVDATIEPTSVAGFNQLFDSYPATDARRYGIGIDHKINKTNFIGVEISKRDLFQPVIDFASNFALLKGRWEERLLRTYWYWKINDYVTSSIEYQYERVSQNHVAQYKNHIMPVSLRFFDNSLGFSAMATLTYVNQNAIMPTFQQDINSSFELLDLSMKYRFPSRHGFIMFSVKNLLDKDFNFVGQSLGGNRSDRYEESPQFFPERTFFCNFTFAF